MKLGLLFLGLLVYANVCYASGKQVGQTAFPLPSENCSLQGPPGQPGIPGTPGTPGIPGTPGPLASCDRQHDGAMRGKSFHRRWKQCSWTFNQHQVYMNSGQLHKCDFVKKRSDSYLRVVYMGNLRIAACTACCSRWYFTFNNVECKNPAPIDGSLYHEVSINIHRPANIEGYCGGIPAGKVKVGFHVGKCAGTNINSAHTMTGWNQSNRVIIEEVEPPVA